jgi:hypothetical protein
MTWSPLNKSADTWSIYPHLLEYEKSCAGFTRDKIRHELDGLLSGLVLKLVHEAVGHF